ncbi:MAG: ABC transporter ATP-binding protein [Pseudobdellovibrionaceae bacterium]
MNTEGPNRFEKIETGGFGNQVFKTLFTAYKPYRVGLFFCFLFGFTGRVLLLANTNILGHWVDQKLQNSEFYLTLMLCLSSVGFLMIWFFRVYFSRISSLSVSQLYDEVTLRTSRYPMSFFDRTPSGRIVTRFSSDYGNVFRLFGGPLAEFFSIVFDLIAMIILALISNKLFIFIVLVFGAMNFALFRLNQVKMRQARRELSASRSPSIAHFSESAHGASLIRVFDKLRVFKKRFAQLDSFYLQKRIDSVKTVMTYAIQMNLLTGLMLLITGLISIYLFEQGLVSLGSIAVAFTFILLSGNTIQMFFEWLAQLEEALVGVERLDKYLRNDLEQGALIPKESQFESTHPVASYESAYPMQDGKLTTNSVLSGTVVVRDLNFRYAPDGPWILQELNIHIGAKEKIGIIGRTGSGKTSLIQCLFHLYPFTQGEIQISGQTAAMNPTDLQKRGFVSLEEFRKLMCFVAQDSSLFRGTLRQNLDLEQTRTDEEIHLMIQKMRIRTGILAGKVDLQMRIEERGKNLSLGERQLICLARAALTTSSVLILDEATSSIDPQTEEIVEHALENLFNSRTQIIIAHRLTTLRKCDRVLWLHQGKIVMFDETQKVLEQFRNSDLQSAQLQGN